jgi:hypothetical protein
VSGANFGANLIRQNQRIAGNVVKPKGQQLGTAEKARDSSPTTRALDFRFLLKSGFGSFAALHMAKLLLAHLLQLSLGLFKLGFLLAKVAFRAPSSLNVLFVLAYHLDGPP